MSITDNEERGSKWTAYIQETIEAYPWTDLKNHNNHMDHHLSKNVPDIKQGILHTVFAKAYSQLWNSYLTQYI